MLNWHNSNHSDESLFMKEISAPQRQSHCLLLRLNYSSHLPSHYAEERKEGFDSDALWNT